MEPSQFPTPEALVAALENDTFMEGALRAAYDVDEPLIRADQTRRIVEALRSGPFGLAAAFVERDFGGGPADA